MSEISEILLENDHQNNQQLNEKLLQDEQLQMITAFLLNKHSTDVIDALTDDEARKRLYHAVLDECLSDSNLIPEARAKVAHYVIAETVGTGFIEKLLKEPSVTDIGWNGRFLTIETRSGRTTVYTPRLNLTEQEAENYVNRVIQKFASATGQGFTETHPNLDATYKNVRINAKHKRLSPQGTTFAMRIVRPYLSLTKSNWSDFAPEFLLEFFKK